MSVGGISFSVVFTSPKYPAELWRPKTPIDGKSELLGLIVYMPSIGDPWPIGKVTIFFSTNNIPIDDYDDLSGII